MYLNKLFNIRVINQILSDILYYNWSYYYYVQHIFITPYYLYLYLDNKYIHINFALFLPYNGITKILQNTFTFCSITILTYVCVFLCSCYFYYVHVVVQFNVVFLFIGMYYSTSAYTCMMSNFSVIYMYMNSPLIFNTVYVSDNIQVQSHYVPKSKLMRGG